MCTFSIIIKVKGSRLVNCEAESRWARQTCMGVFSVGPDACKPRGFPGAGPVAMCDLQ